MADSSEKATASNQPSTLKISQILSSGRRSLPTESRQSSAKALPTRTYTKRLVTQSAKRPDYGSLVKKQDALASILQHKNQLQYCKNLEAENSELRATLGECRETIIKMTNSMNFLLNKVDRMLDNHRQPAASPSRKVKQPRSVIPTSPLPNGDSVTRKHQLPITTLEGFKKFEKNLMIPEFFNNVINSLKAQKIASYIDVTSKLGPQDPETVMIFITKILLAPRVLGQFKWTRRPKDPIDEQIFRKFDFFRSLFMTLVNKVCASVLAKAIDTKAYEQFFRVRITREAIQLQNIIKTQLRELRELCRDENNDEMEVDEDQRVDHEGTSAEAHPMFGETSDAEIKQEPVDFVDVQDSSLVDPSIVKSEPTEVDKAVLNLWTTGSDNES